MKKIGKLIVDNLYGHPEKVTNSHIIYLKIFEFFVAFKTIDYAWEWGLYTLKITDVVLPLGIATMIDISFMHGNILPLVNASIITVLTIITFFRIGWNWQYMVIFVLLHIQYVARFSIGEIPHSANLLGMALFSFAVGLLFFHTRESKYRFIIGFTVFYIGLGYVSASISKLIGTGIFWVDGRHLWLWTAEKATDALSRHGEFEYNLVQILALKSTAIATVILIIGIATEFFGFLMWFRKTRPFITIAIIGMHVGVMLSMNIRFDTFITELIIIGFPWPEWYERYKGRIHSFFSDADKIPV